MAGLNKVMLIGRLGKDPEVISFENGGKKMTVTMATSERYRDRNGQWQDQTEWHNVVAWGNLANDIDEKRRVYAKGDLMFVEGKIRTRQYTDGQGVTKYITEILAEKMNLVAIVTMLVVIIKIMQRLHHLATALHLQLTGMIIKILMLHKKRMIFPSSLDISLFMLIPEVDNFAFEMEIL